VIVEGDDFADASAGSKQVGKLVLTRPERMSMVTMRSRFAASPPSFASWIRAFCMIPTRVRPPGVMARPSMPLVCGATDSIVGDLVITDRAEIGHEKGLRQGERAEAQACERSNS
jgi:hypothetical protein